MCMALIAVQPEFSQDDSVQYVGVSDPRVSNLVELFSEYEFAMVESYPALGTRETIATEIIKLSQSSGFDAGLLVAICRYEDEHYPAEMRLYQFHIETGLTLSDAHLPRVWEDLNRVTNVLTWLKERHEENLMDAVAHYLVGDRLFPPDGFDGLNDEMKGTIEDVFDNADEYQVRIDKPQAGPEIIEVDEEGPPDWEAPYASDNITYLGDDEIRDAYVSVILYYNPYLDETTANTIFEAIAINAEEYEEIDARFVMALVACESSFRPDCVSHAGAMGLGQLMPFTAKKHGVDDPFDVKENIRATYEYLQNEFERWDGYQHIYDYVLASYNAGAGAVKKHGGIPPFDETINYVYKVTKVYKNFLREEEYGRYIYGKSKHYPDSPL